VKERIKLLAGLLFAAGAYGLAKAMKSSNALIGLLIAFALVIVSAVSLLKLSKIKH
jgi:hypothetical protein